MDYEVAVVSGAYEEIVPPTFSSVSRPVCTMLSAISTAGIRPE